MLQFLEIFQRNSSYPLSKCSNPLTIVFPFAESPARANAAVALKSDPITTLPLQFFDSNNFCNIIFDSNIGSHTI